MKYDYLIIGAGLYGAMFAHNAMKQGKKCLIIEKKPYVGGFCHTSSHEGITVHDFGAHIFRTNRKDVWDFVNSIVEFVPFVNSPIARTADGEIYNLPFNMNTFNQLWGCVTPSSAKARIEMERVKCDSPRNLEEHVYNLVGATIYEKFIKGYTEKQWGKKCNELPASIMRRIPLRFTFDNNYFSEQYQGIPKEGYTGFIYKLLQGATILTDTDYLASRNDFDAMADHVVFTGPIDEYYGYCYGKLDFRSVRFEHNHINIDSFQGNAVVNHTGSDVPYTRTIEHKHFDRNCQNTETTIVSYEYPCDNGEPSYPINDEKNNALYAKYKSLADKETNVTFGGRLGEYKYYSMNDIIEKFV